MQQSGARGATNRCRSTGKRSERSSWRLLDHKSDSRGCLLAGTSQAIGKHVRDRTVGTACTRAHATRNSELIGGRCRRPNDAARVEIGGYRVHDRRLRGVLVSSRWAASWASFRSLSSGCEGAAQARRRKPGVPWPPSAHNPAAAVAMTSDRTPASKRTECRYRRLIGLLACGSGTLLLAPV
jgi:hypothetical protein